MTSIGAEMQSSCWCDDGLDSCSMIYVLEYQFHEWLVDLIRQANPEGCVIYWTLSWGDIVRIAYIERRQKLIGDFIACLCLCKSFILYIHTGWACINIYDRIWLYFICYFVVFFSSIVHALPRQRSVSIQYEALLFAYGKRPELIETAAKPYAIKGKQTSFNVVFRQRKLISFAARRKRMVKILFVLLSLWTLIIFLKKIIRQTPGAVVGKLRGMCR